MGLICLAYPSFFILSGIVCYSLSKIIVCLSAHCIFFAHLTYFVLAKILIDFFVLELNWLLYTLHYACQPHSVLVKGTVSFQMFPWQ